MRNAPGNGKGSRPRRTAALHRSLGLCSMHIVIHGRGESERRGPWSWKFPFSPLFLSLTQVFTKHSYLNRVFLRVLTLSSKLDLLGHTVGNHDGGRQMTLGHGGNSSQQIHSFMRQGNEGLAKSRWGTQCAVAKRLFKRSRDNDKDLVHPSRVTKLTLPYSVGNPEICRWKFGNLT